MPSKSLITQQPIHSEMFRRARELRKEMTPAEREMWARLRANRLEGFHFRRQQIIEPYIVDFYCHAAALVIEVDGEIHLGHQEYDNERDQYLQSLGLLVKRFSNSAVFQCMHEVLAEILQDCRIRTRKIQEENKHGRH